MKMLILSLIPIFLVLNAYSQDSTLYLSKYEEFTSRSGVMIKTESFDAGVSDNFKIEVLRSTDLETKESLLAVIISTKQKGLLSLGEYYPLYIDWDECQDFLKALKFQNGLFSEKPMNLVSYEYSTTNGVVSSFSYSPSNAIKGWAGGFSRRYKYSRLPVMGSVISVKPKNLAELINLLGEALQQNY